MAGISKIEIRNSKLSRSNPTSTGIFPNSGVYKIGVELYNSFKYYSDTIVSLLKQDPDRFRPFVGIEEEELIDKNEPCDVIVKYQDLTYTVSLGGRNGGVLSEAITKDGKIMIYRDSEVINYSAEIIGSSYLEAMSDEYFAKSIRPELQNICLEGRDIFWDGFNRITFFDANTYWGREVLLDERQVEEANKIFPRLFDGSVFRVLGNGSYCGSPSQKVIFQYNQGGGGYQSLLALYKMWSETVDRGETLMIKHWDTSLHPIVKNAVLELLEKANNRNGGTLFLATYRDED